MHAVEVLELPGCAKDSHTDRLPFTVQVTEPAGPISYKKKMALP